jgi:hypothetical protein
MQKQLQDVLSRPSTREESVLIQPNISENEIDSNLFDYITQVCDNGSINGVLLRNLIFLASAKNIHRPLEILVEVVDNHVWKLGDMWHNIINDKDMPFTERARLLGLQLDSFFTHIDEISSIFYIYNKQQLTILLHKRCYQLLPIMENVLTLFQMDKSLKSNDLPGLLTIVVILHRFISLRILPTNNEFFSGFILSETDDEKKIVQQVASIANLEHLYETWINRLLIEMSGDALISSFELIPYMNPDIIGDVHCRIMTDRFIKHVDHSISLESAIIKRMQGISIDSDVVWKCSKLIADVEFSQKLLTKYTKTDNKAPSIQPLIINSHLWNISKNKFNTKIVLPEIIQNELSVYEKIASEENQLIQPLNDYGWALIEFDGTNEKTYNIKVTISQLTILCCFSEIPILSCQAISDKTKLPIDRCTSILMAMMRCKMLRRKAYVANNNNGHVLDSFMVNPTFEHKDLDFSITDLDVIMKDNTGNYTQSQIRKAIRYELRISPNKELPVNDLHLRVHMRMNGIESQHYQTAFERLINEEMITDKLVDDDESIAPVIADDIAKNIPGAYCPMVLRNYIFKNDQFRIIDTNKANAIIRTFLFGKLSESNIYRKGMLGKIKMPSEIAEILKINNNEGISKGKIIEAISKIIKNGGSGGKMNSNKKAPVKANIINNNKHNIIRLLTQ